ncbi:MAG: ion transporter [Anaerolineaceae bacterium]|nr:ion transporter [Anaerolineaceae bacterium]
MLRIEKTFRQRCFDILLDDTVEDPLERRFNLVMMVLIFVSVLSVILETDETLSARYQPWFRGFEVFCVATFSIEYLLRLWSCTLDPRFRHPLWGRLRWALTPMALIDLAAVLPFYIPASSLDFRFIRAVRLTRLFRLLKLGHYSQSLQTLGQVLRTKKEQLLVTLFAGLIILTIASSIMYYVEKEAQPEVFNSIGSSMWWGVATLTTIGYGDIYPITPLGKVIGSLIAVLGIGLFAMPAGIIASGFAEELQHKTDEPMICPHCGKVIKRSNNTEYEQ